MLDIRFVVLGLIAAVGLYFVLNETTDHGDAAAAGGSLGPQFEALIDQACSREPEKCECVAPAIRRIAEDEEVLEVFVEMFGRAFQGPGASDRIVAQYRDMPSGLRRRVFAVIEDIDVAGMNRCLARVDPSYARLGYGEMDAETFDALVEALRSR